mmetsp:Transcript_20320/g.70334  ORF Transcript_20320/g.70334 Transcript_20320/m.70334 type:complete len:228 (-) Transcript_20320:182-865(-)
MVRLVGPLTLPPEHEVARRVEDAVRGHADDGGVRLRETGHARVAARGAGDDERREEVLGLAGPVAHARARRGVPAPEPRDLVGGAERLDEPIVEGEGRVDVRPPRRAEEHGEVVDRRHARPHDHDALGPERRERLAHREVRRRVLGPAQRHGDDGHAPERAQAVAEAVAAHGAPDRVREGRRDGVAERRVAPREGDAAAGRAEGVRLDDDDARRRARQRLQEALQHV